MSHATQRERDAARALVDQLVVDQGRLSAAFEFARAHDRGEIAASTYRHLMPLSAPKGGEQYAFEVDLDKCSGCKACVTACHALNGLDDGEAWRQVGMLTSEDWRRPFRQTVPTTCHHCAEPACLLGCPVLAYEKDPLNGIVRHLDDQCIGCQYCVMMCPYEVPQYSKQRGIVRKCDLCSQRLAVGEAPACAQACPGEAIRITLVEADALRVEFRDGRDLKRNSFLPSSPDPAITLPTTRFVSRKTLAPDLIAADESAERIQPAHWPLVWMLVLTQLGVGAVMMSVFGPAAAQRQLTLLAMTTVFMGLGASVLHLGRPAKAWKSFLGVRTSWLSREILVFGVFAGLLGAVAILETAAQGSAFYPGLVWATVLCGLAGVFCSAMVYHSTRRIFWMGLRSVGRFSGTTALLGLSAGWLIAAAHSDRAGWVPLCLAAVAVIKLGAEHRLLRRGDAIDDLSPTGEGFDGWSLAKSAIIMREKYGAGTRLRFALGVFGVVVPALASFLAPERSIQFALIAFTSSFIGEVIERFLFFRAVAPPRMPGYA